MNFNGMDFAADIARRDHEITLSSEIPRPPRNVYNSFNDHSSEHSDSSQNNVDYEADTDMILESLNMIHRTTAREEHIGMAVHPNEEQVPQYVVKPSSLKTDINSNITVAECKPESKPLSVQSTLSVYSPEFVPRIRSNDEPVLISDWSPMVVPSPDIRPLAGKRLEELALSIKQPHVEPPLDELLPAEPLAELSLGEPSLDKPSRAEPLLAEPPLIELPLNESPATIPPLDKMLHLRAQLDVQSFFEPKTKDKKMRCLAMESLIKKEKRKLKLIPPEFFQVPKSAGTPPQIKLELKSQTKTEWTLQPKTECSPQPKTEETTRPKTQAKLELESKKQPKPQPKLESKTQLMPPEPKSQSEVWTKTEWTLQPKTECSPQQKTEVTTRPKRDFKSKAKPIEHPSHIQMHPNDKVTKWLHDTRNENKPEDKPDITILENSYFAVPNIPKSSHSSVSNVGAPAAAGLLVQKSNPIKEYKPSNNFDSILAKLNQNRKPAEEQQVASRETSPSTSKDTLNDLIENAIKNKDMKKKKETKMEKKETNEDEEK